MSDCVSPAEDALTRHAQAIRVTVREENKVSLEGRVGSRDEREAVEIAAWSAAGVQSVDDRLTIVR
jgi:hyperosmotically inducible protein